MSVTAPDLLHEISSPVTVIAWSLQQLAYQAQKHHDPLFNKILTPALESMEYLENLVAMARKQDHDLSYFPSPLTQISVADAPVERVIKTTLAVVLERTVRMFTPQLKVIQARCSVLYSPAVGRLVLPLSPTLWQEVVVNLIGNAIDALSELPSTAPKKIWLSAKLIPKKTPARNATSDLCLNITDTGPGISPDLLPRIFDRHVSTKGKKGTGLGLAIVKQIVENQLAGKITASSAPGGGKTCFSVTIPVSSSMI